MAIAALVVGIPSALSKGANDTLTHMSMTFSGITLTSFMDIMDFVWGSFFIIIVALFICLYVGWVIGPTRIIAELSEGTPSFATKKFAGLSAAQVWAFFIRFVCPLVIIIVILNQFNIF